MSVRDVKGSFTQVAQDKKIDARDVDRVLQSPGNISRDEERALREGAQEFDAMMDPDGRDKLSARLGEVSQLRVRAGQINGNIEARKPRLDADITQRLSENAPTTTFGGTPLPEAVKTVMREQFAAGAVAYDVLEMNPDPVYDASHGEPVMTIEGKFNPYAQDQYAADSMAFDHTELTPEKIQQDISTTQTWQELEGYTQDSNKRRIATFRTVTGKPTGRITELYDEASWADTMARGRGGQKYASNFAILADGSVHAVPASRRSSADPRRILTNASLARGRQMAFNGHLHLDDSGTVTYVGRSGRLGKLEERGEAKFLDPLAVLRAWGFKIAPGLTVTQE